MTLPDTGLLANVPAVLDVLAEFDARAVAAEREELAAEVAERMRFELSLIGLADRLRAALGEPLSVEVPGHVVAGRLADVLSDAVVVRTDRCDVAVPLQAVLGVWPVCPEGLVPIAADAVSQRLGLRSLLRDRIGRPALVRRRSALPVTGRIQRVGSDHLELLAALGVGRVVPFSAVAVVEFG